MERETWRGREERGGRGRGREREGAREERAGRGRGKSFVCWLAKPGLGEIKARA